MRGFHSSGIVLVGLLLFNGLTAVGGVSRS